MSETTETGNIAIYRFLDEQMELFKELLIHLKSGMDEETIHRLRVAVKKIRTIQKLKKHINFPTSIHKTHFKAIKEIFAVSGHMRDLQIQQNLLAGYISKIKIPFHQLTAFLTERHKIFETALQEKILETDFGDFAENQENDIAQKEKMVMDIKTESIDFLGLKINAINRLIYTLDRDDFVHDLRKELKQLFFILLFLIHHFQESAFSEYALKSLRKITDRIGQWNDRDVFNNMLQEFIDGQADDFLLQNPEYTILQYMINSEKAGFMCGIDVDIYLEMIKLKALIQKAE